MKILVELEGVLRGENDAPISTGIIFAGTLSVHNKITFFTSLSRAEAEQWLNVNHILDYDDLITSEVGLVGEELKERQVLHARSKGGLDLVVTSSPVLWAFTFEQGLSSIMFGVPSYLRIEFRPDIKRKIRPWDSIESALKKEHELRTKDARQSRNEGPMFE